MELSTEANTSAFYNSVVMFPNKLHSPRRFHFQSTHSDLHLDQKTKSKGVYTASNDSRSKIVVWPCETTKNIHSGQSGVRNMAGYIMIFCTDASLCYICMKAQWEESSTKRDLAFISTRP